MKILIIINPISGTERARRNAQKAVQYIEKEFNTKAVKTQYAGHATELTKQAVAENLDLIVAVGGDGTVNEIASALVGTETALFIIPTGSGNGLARDLGMFNQSATEMVSQIKRNESYRIDCGFTENRYFFCTCGTGFDALIGHLFSKTKIRGFLTYIKLCLKAYINYTSQTYTIQTEQSKHTHQAFVVNIANNKQFGNHAYIAPMANMTDGLFTVTIIKPFKWYHVPYMAYCLFFKCLHTNKFVETFNCGDCTLRLPANAKLHIDGEPIVQSTSDIFIKMQKASLKVVMG